MRYRLLAATALLLVWLGPGVATDPEPAMTDEEVVRRLVAGESVETLVSDIERRETQFDLSSEMLEELRRAGLPQAIIEAMRERQAEQEPEVAEPTEAQATPRVPQLRVTLSGKKGGISKLSIVKDLDLAQVYQWKLGNAPEDRVYADLALYLVCRTADHVPDHWRNKSPMGRDFFSMPRHRMLTFVSGSSNAEAKRGGFRIRLELPPAIEVELEPDVAHDLTLGLAVQVAGRYYSWKHDTWNNVILTDAGLELAATIQGSNLSRLHVEFQNDDEDEDDE